MLLWNGVLWGRRGSGLVRKFDLFSDYGGGGFHPSGNETNSFWSPKLNPQFDVDQLSNFTVMPKRKNAIDSVSGQPPTEGDPKRRKTSLVWNEFEEIEKDGKVTSAQ
ncbi:hypothetical protein IFM89_034008 [Coptis chinensis]|uniref:Uncharacterized protein n=1 Tax=Coptis chinensis TaxID=261450 RepID=A0A835ITH1_9MAGN|nr:hypothetical protein IFM89_034008 [Coptis chinensis]